MKENWREHLLERIDNLFRGTRNSSILYGLGHSLAVEEGVQKILAKNKIFIDIDRIPAIIGAALLHDIGYSKRAKYWTLDWFAHISVGKKIARDILSEIPFFRNKHELINKILYLIEHHDDTIYSFPIINNNGKPKVDTPIGVDLLELSILREADSLVHVMDKAVSEAIDEWVVYSLPLSVDSAVLSPGWLWNESIINNIRLLAKRSILDTFTKKGKQLSLDTYDKLENQIQRICLENNIVYQAEISHPRDRKASIERISSKYDRLQIISFHGLDETIRHLHKVSLLNDKNIHPYEYSKVRLQVVDFSKITPMALYLVKGRLDETLEFHDALMYKFAFGLWDLSGLLKFRYNSNKIQRIAPPLVEAYQEKNSFPKANVWGLVDGLHRFRVAQQLDYNNVWVMTAYDVEYPLVPLPVTWKEIEEYFEMPKYDEKKRRYRYVYWTDVPFEIKKRFNINKDNYKYFFYRDLRPIGSKGKRGFDEFK